MEKYLMLILKQKRIYRSDLENNRNILYIFGDNLERQGLGGQAGEMRGEPNAFGFATKRAISHGNDSDYLFDGDYDTLRIIMDEYRNLLDILQKTKYDAVVIPEDGIGTGLARMKENAPNALKVIDSLLETLNVVGTTKGK